LLRRVARGGSLLAVMLSVQSASVRHRSAQNAFDLLGPDDHGGKLIASTVSMLGGRLA
jgi:hypothetical protein